MNFVAGIALVMILARWAKEEWLAHLNRAHVRAHADAVPETLSGVMDAATYARSVEYTLARSRCGIVTRAVDVVVLLAVLFSGVLPAAFNAWEARLGGGAWSMTAFLLALGIALSIPGLPFDWHAQFRLEARFGFNTMTLRTWLLDRVKGSLLAMVIGAPLLALVFKIIGWTGAQWWLWAWAAVVVFQVTMMLVAPAIIMPLFNKFTPLPEGPLRERLFALARRTEFPTRSIEVMDGSRRSRHSNAFFTGFGRFRKIVLFDTLVGQLGEAELEAVLAHEIGHWKRRHVVKLVVVSMLGLLVAFALIAGLQQREWFLAAFGFAAREGFAPAAVTPALLLFSLLAGAGTFWLSPLINAWSRRYEFEADAFARRVMDGPEPLIGALRKLSEKNLSNLTPHPLYSRFHYSHPTLEEREQALRTGDVILPKTG
jgi:STE24 endopeptidase